MECSYALHACVLYVVCMVYMHTYVRFGCLLQQPQTSRAMQATMMYSFAFCCCAALRNFSSFFFFSGLNFSGFFPMAMAGQAEQKHVSTAA